MLERSRQAMPLLPVQRWRSMLQELLPGFVLVGVICLAAYGLRLAPYVGTLSVMIIATLLGALVRNVVSLPGNCEPGVAFVSKVLLRVAIVLLGLQLTVGDLLDMGPVALMLVVMVPATIGLGFLIGRLMGVPAKLTALVSMGVGICGASAIAATREVVKADNEDVGYSLMAITLFGTISMLVYPLIATGLGLSATQYGVWAGASIHEVAQVIGAAFQLGDEAGEAGVTSKLARVLLLAPVLVVLLSLSRLGSTEDGATRARVPLVPGFIVFFMAMVALASIVAIPASVVAASSSLSQVLMALALAGLGLGIDFRKLAGLGWKPAALGGITSVLMAVASLAYVMLAM